MINDEIKEKKTKRIIEKIAGLATYVTIPRELAIYNVNIDSQEAKLLIDYITNLQHENERLKKLEYKFIDNCGENESFTLGEYLDIGNKLYDSEREKEDYKSQVEKAIKIYDDTITYLTTINAEYMDSNTKKTIQDIVNKLEKELDILNGRSDE